MLSAFRHRPTLLRHFQCIASDEACFRRLVLLVCARSYAPPWVSFQVSARAAPSQRPSLHSEPPPAAAHTQQVWAAITCDGVLKMQKKGGWVAKRREHFLQPLLNPRAASPLTQNVTLIHISCFNLCLRPTSWMPNTNRSHVLVRGLAVQSIRANPSVPQTDYVGYARHPVHRSEH